MVCEWPDGHPACSLGTAAEDWRWCTSQSSEGGPGGAPTRCRWLELIWIPTLFETNLQAVFQSVWRRSFESNRSFILQCPVVLG